MPEYKTHTLVVDDTHTIPFKLDYNRACDIEDALGRSIFDVLADITRSPSVVVLREILFVGAQGKENDFNRDLFGDVIGRMGINAVIAIVSEAASDLFGTSTAPAKAKRRAKAS